MTLTLLSFSFGGWFFSSWRSTDWQFWGFKKTNQTLSKLQTIIILWTKLWFWSTLNTSIDSIDTVTAIEFSLAELVTLLPRVTLPKVITPKSIKCLTGATPTYVPMPSAKDCLGIEDIRKLRSVLLGAQNVTIMGFVGDNGHSRNVLQDVGFDMTKKY